MQWGAWAGSGMAVTHNLLPRIIKSGVVPFQVDSCPLIVTGLYRLKLKTSHLQSCQPSTPCRLL